VKKEQSDRPQLTAEQRRIVNSKAALAEVRAYAGTGKTHTLVARVKELLRRGAKTGEVLVLTFSNDGVETLRARLPSAVPAMTLHSFGMGLVRRSREPRRLIQGKAELSLVKQALKAQASKSKDSQPAAAKRMKEAAASEADSAFIAEFFALLAAGQAPKYVVAEKGSDFVQLEPFLGILANVYSRLQRVKRRAGVITFADMVLLALEALNAQPEMSIKHILVDEYQDCTPTQTLVIQALAKRAETVMAFGDPKQAIYGFAGARFTALKEILPGVKSYRLTRSFRLKESNANLATVVLRQRDRTSPALIGTNGKGRRPQEVKCAKASMQPQAVVQIIKGLIADGAKAHDIAILGRVKAQLREVDKALLAADLDTRALYRDRSRKPLLAAIKSLDRLERIAPNLTNKERNSRLDKLLAGIPAARVVSQAALAGCRRRLVSALLSDKIETRLSACISVHITMQGGRKAVGPDVQDELIRWVPHSRPFSRAADLRKHVEDTRRNSRVRTSTIHGAKGREWEHVVVLNVVDGSLPYYRSGTPSKMAEEHNLFYVAITRAKDRLFLIQAPFVGTNGPRVHTFDEPSPFTAEVEESTLKKVLYRRD
jgi:DNA helicase II / ATP-dependent DNA helicase PcrA